MKQNQILLSLAIVAALTAAEPTQAQSPLSPSAEATIRDGANFAVDLNESTLGYLMVKYGTGNSGKAYFKFNFTGLNPNTNDTLSFTFTTANNSGRQHPMLWALNQAYPGFNSSVLIWRDAQANQTNGNGMLTDPTNTYTATPLVDFISPSGAGATATVRIPAPWGDFLIGNELVLVMTSPFNDPTNASAGLRLALNQTYLSYQTLVGAPPSLSILTNITAVPGEYSPTNSFTVNDPEDGPDFLYPFATSSNEAVVPSGNIFIEGTGASRKVYVIAVSSGVADITVSVTDSSGNMAQRVFRVTAVVVDNPPALSALPPTNTFVNVPLTIPFTVWDEESPASTLTVTGAVASYSAGLLADLSFTADGSGSNRTVTVTPVTDASGVGIVTLTATDTNNNATNISFAVMILPNARSVFYDSFDYPLNTSILNSSPGFWVRRNASPQSLNLRTSNLAPAAWIRPKSGADDGAARLAGAPYLPGAGVTLYLKFQAQWVEAGDVPVVGDSSGPFVLLAPNATATADQICQIATRTNGVPEGFFRLLISNGSGTYTELSSADLVVGNTYQIVVRYDVDTATATLWVDAAGETAPGATATDTQNPIQATHVCLRQEPGMGNIYIDDLTVLAVSRPRIITLTPPSGGNVDLYFWGGSGDTAGDFAVQRAADLTGGFTDVSSAITDLGGNQFKATVAASGDQGFYRVRRLPLNF